jgi:hypothetical protein
MADSDYSYEGVRRISYDFGPILGVCQFVPVCPHCSRFVKADPTLDGNATNDDPNATCSRCGRISMPSEGFI